MELTETQKRSIGGYFRAVDDLLSDLPESERRRALAQVRGTLERRLSNMAPLEDGSVERAIAACGSPEEVAAGLRRYVRQSLPQDRSDEDRVLLGVCAYAARRLQTDPIIVRMIVCALALILPLTPLIIVAYLSAYLAVAYSPDGAGLPRPNYWRVAKSAAVAAAVGIALRVGFGLLLTLPQRLAFNLLGEAVRIDPGWAWLELNLGASFFWAMAYAVPLAALSEFPVPSAWAQTLHKVWQAALAVYAVILCAGLAAYVVGFVLALAAGLSDNPAVSDFLTL